MNERHVTEFLESHGFDPKGGKWIAVVFGYRTITVVKLKQNNLGGIVIAGDEPVIETQTLHYEKGE